MVFCFRLESEFQNLLVAINPYKHLHLLHYKTVALILRSLIYNKSCFFFPLSSQHFLKL